MEKINREDVINRLKNDDDYYGDYGRQFLSNSDIGTLISNPAGYNKTREDSVNLMYGRAFHELIMFGKTSYDTHVDASTRRTNKYKEAEEEAGRIIFLKKEWDEINQLVDATKKHKVVKEILKSKDIEFEVPNIGVMDSGEVMWKCKADIILNESIVDIKTSSNIAGFKHSSKTWNYDSQAYIYSTMFQKPMQFLVIDKSTGCVGLFDVSDEAYENGREKVRQAEANYLDYFVNKTKKLEDYTVYGTI